LRGGKFLWKKYRHRRL